jgi:hypothetical protein
MRLAPVCFIREQPIESRGSVEAPDLLVTNSYSDLSRHLRGTPHAGATH